MANGRFRPPALRESRLLYERESGFWEHLKEYGKDIGHTYVSEGIEDKDPIKMATGAVMLPLSILAEGPDQVWSGITGQKYEAPGGIAGRTRRDVKLLFKDVFTFHPLRAAGDAWRLVTSSLPLDGGDVLGGHHIHDARHSVHAQVSETLAA